MKPLLMDIPCSNGHLSVMDIPCNGRLSVMDIPCNEHLSVMDNSKSTDGSYLN